MTGTTRRGPLTWVRALLGRGPQAAAPLFESPEVNVPELTAVHAESTVAFETPPAAEGSTSRSRSAATGAPRVGWTRAR
ncbi:hypothetical protein [Streptomyces sirii]|uniref:hypothetical protein n=1 Tax=Streptomyces sirii TaxID=3127701 RepID=UPI003D36DC6D